MKNIFVLLFAALSIVSCVKIGRSVPVSDQADDYNVKFLFEVDSVKVYRFRDGGQLIYFTNTSGKTSYTWSNGKCSEEVQSLNIRE